MILELCVKFFLKITSRQKLKPFKKLIQKEIKDLHMKKKTNADKNSLREKK